MAQIIYKTDQVITAENLADVFRRSGLRRPVDDLARIQKAAPSAQDYYPKIGFEAVENGWIIKRQN